MPNHQIGRFLKKHNKILAYIGASLVLLTLIVREGLRETWKERSDTIDAAMSAMIIQHGTTTVIMQVNELSGKIDNLNRRSLTASNLQEYGRIEHELNEAYNFDAEESLQISCVGLLVSKLPEDDPLREKLATLAKEFLANGNSVELVDAQFHLLGRGQGALTSDTVNNVVKQYGPQIHSLKLSSIDLSAKLTALTRDATKDAQLILARDRRRAEVAWWAWACLSLTFWGVGLLGLIYDLKGPHGSE